MMLKVNSNKLKWTEARTSTKVLTVWPICPEINQNVCVFQLPIVVVGGLRLALVSVGVGGCVCPASQCTALRLCEGKPQSGSERSFEGNAINLGFNIYKQILMQ